VDSVFSQPSLQNQRRPEIPGLTSGSFSSTSEIILLQSFFFAIAVSVVVPEIVCSPLVNVEGCEEVAGIAGPFVCSVLDETRFLQPLGLDFASVSSIYGSSH
jgi:hypothetical protein